MRKCKQINNSYTVLVLSDIISLREIAQFCKARFKFVTLSSISKDMQCDKDD